MAESETLPVAAARAGSAEAWDSLFRRYQLPLYVYVRELVHHEQASLDIVQETFISAVRYLDTLREPKKFGSWLFGIAHQKAIQHWRRRDREELRRVEVADLPTEYEEAPDELLIREEEQALFMERLNQLPPAQRSVLLLHFVEDFSLEEIASITETALGTVKSRLHYARKALRKLMEQKT